MESKNIFTIANEFYHAGLSLGLSGNLTDALLQFQHAIAKLLKIPQADKTEAYYSTLAKNQHNMAVTYHKLGDKTDNHSYYQKAIICHSMAINSLLEMNERDADDLHKISQSNKAIYDIKLKYCYNVNELDEECKWQINKLEIKQPPEDEDYRCLSRWHVALASLQTEANPIQRLKTAIDIQNKIAKRQESDDIELGNAHHALASAYIHKGRLAANVNSLWKLPHCATTTETSIPVKRIGLTP